jgi:hypothetical protein
LALIIAVFLFNLTVVCFAQNLNLPYLAPAKDYNPQIYKYIFSIPQENTTSKQESQDSKPKKTQSILSDSTENNLEISYSPIGEPIKLTVTVKEKDKKINITLFNLIGNKVADLFNDIPKTNEIEIEKFPKEIEKLSNGVYICILQGYNYRLMKKFNISR